MKRKKTPIRGKTPQPVGLREKRGATHGLHPLKTTRKGSPKSSQTLNSLSRGA